MVRSARHDIGLFLDLAGELADDKTPAVVNSVRSRVAFTAEKLAAAAAGPGIATVDPAEVRTCARAVRRAEA